MNKPKISSATRLAVLLLMFVYLTPVSATACAYDPRTIRNAALAKLATPYQTAPPVLPASALQTTGYRSLSSARGAQHPWNKDRFLVTSIRHQTIKSIAPYPGSSNMFFRFTISEEQYPSSEAATARFNAPLLPCRIRQIDKHQPEYGMHWKYQIDQYIYFVSTDVLMFYNHPEYHRMQTHIQGYLREHHANARE